jgi:methionyl-tRNA formyltransferase
VRAFTTWPGTFTEWNGTLLKVLSGEAVDGQASPGLVMRQDGRIGIGTGQGIYVLERVQVAGKPVADAHAFVNGYPDFVGSTLR